MTWKTTLSCNRAEAEAIALSEAFADLAEPPTLLTDEPDPGRPDDWTFAAYTTERPNDELLARMYALAPSAPPGSAAIEKLVEADWTVLSQANLVPVRAGRFLVHTGDHADAVRPGDIAIRIEAGLAFGTGQHDTTHGCLTALDALAACHRFANIADIGTGSGVLAIAAARRWPGARVIASDIDPVSVAVASGNARANRVRLGRTRGTLELATAAGLEHGRLRTRGPYDLVAANILAAPLIALAAGLARALAPGGTLILAGLLDTQAREVAAAYVRRGMRLVTQHGSAQWPTLVLRQSLTGATRGTAGHPPSGR